MNNLIGRGHTILVVGIDRKIIGNTRIQGRQFQCRCKDLMRLVTVETGDRIANLLQAVQIQHTCIDRIDR